MTEEEFHAWLRDEVAGRRMYAAADGRSCEAAISVRQHLRQRRQSAPAASVLSHEDRGGYVAEQLRMAAEIHALIDAAEREFPKRMIFRADRL